MRVEFRVDRKHKEVFAIFVDTNNGEDCLCYSKYEGYDIRGLEWLEKTKPINYNDVKQSRGERCLFYILNKIYGDELEIVP